MTVIFCIAGVGGWFTTDPEVVPNSRHFKKGDFVKLPDGRIFLFETDYPPKFVHIALGKVPAGAVVLNAQNYKT